ncbi:MAG: efflux RND transporter permease subunit [Spirochaetia bacterium]
MKIADYSIKHPAVIIILLISVLLFGAISLRSLKQDLLSEVSLPTVVVFTTYPGVGPMDMEREITNVLEKEIATMPGIEAMSSNSTDSASIISLEFEWGTDIDTKMGELREKINNVTAELPDGIQGPPTILKVNTDLLPIMTVVVESELDAEVLTRYVDEQIIPAVSRVDGVAAVNRQGGVEHIVSLELDTAQLEARNLSILAVYELLSYYNLTVPSGTVTFRGKEMKLRTGGDFDSLDQIRNLVIGHTEGTYIRLKDVAEVTIQPRDRNVYALSGSTESIILDIMKQQKADTNVIVAEVERILAGFSREQQGAVFFKPVVDQSEDIKNAINSVRDAAVTGGFLAVFILLIFLHNIRTTIIIAVSIPLSVMVAFIALNLNGQSLNIMTLGGMTVGIGMIVDSSIVVLENIFRHFKHTGDRNLSASRGTGEVGSAIVASTATTLSVFIPLLFVQGFAGVILRDVAYTIVYALLASLLVAVVVVPFLTSRLLKENEKRKNNRFFRFFTRRIEGFIDSLTEAYKRGLAGAIRNRWFVLIFAGSVLIVSVLAFSFVGFEFVPETDMNELQIDVETPQGFSLEQTRNKILEIDRIIQEKVPELDEVIYYVGQGDSFGFGKSVTSMFGRIRLISSKKRERDVFEIRDVLRKEIMSRVPDVDFTISNGGLGALASVATGGQGFKVEIYGTDFDDVARSAEQTAEIIRQDPNVTKTEMNIRFDREELVADLALDYMGTLGITPYEAGVISRIIFNGMEAGTFRDGGRSYDIILKSDLTGTSITPDVLNRLSVRSSRGAVISFAAFTELETVPSVSGIHHENKMKSIIVTGLLRNTNVRDTSSRVTGKLKAADFPAGIRWDVVGTTAEMAESFRVLFYALLVSVFLVYAVMVIQFEKFVQPLIIMAAVPFTVIGVVAGLLLFGSTLSIVSFLGVIALAGIVVNNAIVMVDYINLLRRRDNLSLTEALLEGGSSRLRPILMTTLTTVLGILPMAFGMGEGSQMYAPLGQAIAGGLVTSTLITLFLVPVLYHILESRHDSTDQEEPVDEEVLQYN